MIRIAAVLHLEAASVDAGRGRLAGATPYG